MTTPRASIHAARFCGALALTVTGCASQAHPEPVQPGWDLTADDIRRTPDVPIEKALMAQVPGVWITRTSDGGIAIRIRRATTLAGGAEPLYIVDGVAFDPGPGGSLSAINPYEISSIRVLKDPVDTAMYGVRGANGVIVIRTKSARR